MNYTNIDILAFDIGRFLHAILGEVDFSLLSRHVITFVLTFTTRVNLDDENLRSSFFYHVGKGYAFALAEEEERN